MYMTFRRGGRWEKRPAAAEGVVEEVWFWVEQRFQRCVKGRFSDMAVATDVPERLFPQPLKALLIVWGWLRRG
jgi:hypothetical protein